MSRRSHHPKNHHLRTLHLKTRHSLVQYQWDAKKSNLRIVVLIYRRGKEKKAKRANSAVFFYLAALTFVNVPGVSRIAVKVKALSVVNHSG